MIKVRRKEISTAHRYYICHHQPDELNNVFETLQGVPHVKTIGGYTQIRDKDWIIFHDNGDIDILNNNDFEKEYEFAPKEDNDIDEIREYNHNEINSLFLNFIYILEMIIKINDRISTQDQKNDYRVVAKRTIAKCRKIMSAANA